MAQGISKTQLVLLRGSLRSVVVIGLAYAIFRSIEAFSGDLSWQARVDNAQSMRLPLAADANAVWEGEVLLMLDDPGLRLSVLAVLPAIVVGLAAALVAFMLLRITYATDEGAPFFDTSARRLRVISRVIAIAAVLSTVLHSVANTEIVRAALESDDQVSADLPLAMMLTGLLVALVVRVIAEAFRIGTELRRDTEGLV